MRTQGDRVALLIARRELETWIHFYLSGPPVDEHTACAKLTGREADCQEAAAGFARDAQARTAPQQQAPPSLATGIAELARVI